MVLAWRGRLLDQVREAGDEVLEGLALLFGLCCILVGDCPVAVFVGVVDLADGHELAAHDHHWFFRINPGFAPVLAFATDQADLLGAGVDKTYELVQLVVLKAGLLPEQLVCVFLKPLVLFEYLPLILAEIKLQIDCLAVRKLQAFVVN